MHAYLSNILKAISVMFLLITLSACGIQGNDMLPEEKVKTVEIEQKLTIIPCTPEVCFAYYFHFDIDRITGIHEENMERYAKFYFDQNDLQDILEKKNLQDFLNPKEANSNSYHYNDVRVKIVLHDKIYFIDTSGYMRESDNYYKISIPKFNNIIDNRELLEEMEM